MTNLTAVLVIAICAAVAAAGLVLVARWGGVAPPPPPRRYAAICLAGGAGAGLIAAGAGGRLVMRLLALTSPDAEGALTEAQATIGEITLGFVVFAGLPAGVLAGIL